MKVLYINERYLTWIIGYGLWGLSGILIGFLFFASSYEMTTVEHTQYVTQDEVWLTHVCYDGVLDEDPVCWKDRFKQAPKGFLPQDRFAFSLVLLVPYLFFSLIWIYSKQRKFKIRLSQDQE
jgi:hypothetical protein